MKKSFYLILVSFMLLRVSVAQSQTTYFLKNNGDYAPSRKAADFIRIVANREGEMGLHPINEFYLSGSKKSTGHSFRKDPPLYHGQVLSYFENGATRQVMQYEQGTLVDTSMLYYPNGKLYQVVRYSKPGDSSGVYIETINDSTGIALTTNGNGNAVVYDSDFKYITAQGNLKDGKYNGEWNGEIRSDDILRYKEIYEDGKLLSGESVDKQGNHYSYTESEVKPAFKDGIKNFYIYVIRSVRYPPQLAMKRIRGVAQISFIVLPNGKVSDAHAINDVHPALAAEVIRVLKGAKGWIPGRRKGRPAAMSFVMPFTFNTAW